MFETLPQSAAGMLSWSWDQFQSYYEDLFERALTADSVADYLADWTRLSERLDEVYSRLYVATTVNTADSDAEKAFGAFLDGIYPKSQEAEQKLKTRLLESRLEPENFALPLLKMKTDAEIYRDANLPLLTREQKMDVEYNKTIGAQAVEWEGRELTLSQLQPVFQEPDRERRESAWRLASSRQLADRAAINQLWKDFIQLRLQLAANAQQPDFRALRWKQMKRFDYTPEDCRRFHQAIEAVAVPAATRIYEKRRKRLGLRSLRPWDLDVDPLGRSPLRPFQTGEELQTKAAAMFHQVDPQLGGYFQQMIQEGLLDLENRKNKAPGGYCITFAACRSPFIFMNAVGVHDNVQTLLHEGGHAFHVYEMRPLPYHQQLEVGMEFAEVASMAMELLASPYLEKKEGGFYTQAEAARARIEHLERNILFFPYMAVVDAFQHWVYENPSEAQDASQCDACWTKLWKRFIPGVDWSGLEEQLATGWHRKLHIHCLPFYYVEYGLALLGSVQIWSRALKNQSAAVKDYRKALALGGTASLPQLYATAGAKFTFDEAPLKQAIELMESTLESLEDKDAQ